MSTAIQPDPDEDAPLPLAQFKRFLAIFHIVFLGGLVFCLVLRWRRPDLVWTWQDLVLLGLVTLQAALYVLFFVFLWKPPTALRWWPHISPCPSASGWRRGWAGTLPGVSFQLQ